LFKKGPAAAEDEAPFTDEGAATRAVPVELRLLSFSRVVLAAVGGAGHDAAGSAAVTVGAARGARGVPAVRARNGDSVGNDCRGRRNSYLGSRRIRLHGARQSQGDRDGQ